jgi:hypothetical protein
MSLFKESIDCNLLNRVLEWIQSIGIVEFEREQAVASVFVATRWRHEAMPEDNEAIFLIALNAAFWFWFDDQSDKHIHEAISPINWERIIGISEEKIITDSLETPEETFLIHLSTAMKQKARTEAEYQWWFNTFASTFRGMQFEETVARTKIMPSFVECLEYGILSVAILNFLGATYLAYGMGRPLQENDFVLSHLEHCFGAYQRILNDIKSAQKERGEGKSGYFSNVLLLMEGLLSPQIAQEFLLSQLDGYERLIMADIKILGINNPFAQLIDKLFTVVLTMYQSPPKRMHDTQTNERSPIL